MQVSDPTNLPLGSPALNGVKVLCVDNEPDVCDLVTVLLTQGGAQVTTAASVSEALIAFQRLPPDVLIVDIETPDADGYVLLQQIRALGPEQGGQIPAIALTAHVYPGDRIRALSEGFQMYVPKPFDPEELMTLVAHLAR